MAKVTKARIIYSTGEGPNLRNQELRFHSVISEDHTSSTEVTKFPVQSGFNISNNAIKKNRSFKITAVISNLLLVGSREFHEYGKNNVRIVYEGIRQLIHQAIPCEVQTNYTTYTPVIFTGFNTKMVAGRTDSMEFTITGEEVQLALTINKSSPALLHFRPMSAGRRESRLKELLNAGIEVPENASLSEASFNLNRSCQIDTTNSVGDITRTTYELMNHDAVNNIFYYLVHTNDTKIIPAPTETHFNWYGLLQEEAQLLEGTPLEGFDLTESATSISTCVGRKFRNVIDDYATNLIETNLGLLRKTAYGVAYDIIGIDGNAGIGQQLLNFGVDCFVAEVTNENSLSADIESSIDNVVFSIEDTLRGAENKGLELTSNVALESFSNITKISPPAQGTLVRLV